MTDEVAAWRDAIAKLDLGQSVRMYGPRPHMDRRAWTPLEMEAFLDAGWTLTPRVPRD
jgi:hypothetical protein